MKNVDVPAVALVDGADDETVAGLPDEVRIALAGTALGLAPMPFS